ATHLHVKARPRKTKNGAPESGGPRARKLSGYFLSSFLSSFFSAFLISPLPPHFSHSLPSLAAATQHLCEQVLPSSAAFLQQAACSASAVLARNATAQTAAIRLLN